MDNDAKRTRKNNLIHILRKYTFKNKTDEEKRKYIDIWILLNTFLTFQFIQGITPGDAIYRSFTHMVTYSLEIDKSKWSYITLAVLQSQILMGVFMMVISLARFLSLSPQPKSMNEMKNHYNGTVIKSQELMDMKKELEEIKKMMSDKINQ